MLCTNVVPVCPDYNGARAEDGRRDQFLRPGSKFELTTRHRLRPAARELVEQLLVERLVHLFGPHRQEYVTADKLVDHLAVGRLAREDYVALLELDHHVFHFPVDVPRLSHTPIQYITQETDLESLRVEVGVPFIRAVLGVICPGPGPTKTI